MDFTNYNKIWHVRSLCQGLSEATTFWPNGLDRAKLLRCEDLTQMTSNQITKEPISKKLTPNSSSKHVQAYYNIKTSVKGLKF